MLKLFSSLQSLIYSQRCIYCGQIKSYICGPCNSRINSKPFKVYKSTTLVFSGAYYSPELRQIIVAAKENDDKNARAILANFLQSAMTLALDFNYSPKPIVYVIPIPSRESANRIRGFKHSLVLANLLSNNFKTRQIIVIDCLALTRRVRDQAGLTVPARNINMAGAHTLKFARDQKIYAQILSQENQEIYIVDDLVTTGATITAAKLALASGKIKVSGVLASCATTGIYALR